MSSRLLLLACAVVTVTIGRAQSPTVPLYLADSRADTRLQDEAKRLRDAGALSRETVLTNQFTRTSCQLALPAPRSTRLAGRELWAASRAAHVRVGWNFLCTKCNNWHLNLAGGYALTKDGAVATCFHVVKLPANFKEGFLIATDEQGRMHAVTEILAGDERTDACIIRTSARDLKPLPLSTNVFPGDRAFCFSDPLGQRGYFSDGIVNRFLARHPNNSTNLPPVTRLNVTTDWAPGSSGSAVLDELGNAIGHVTTITTLPSVPTPKAGDSTSPKAERTLITLHEAVSARDVLALIQKPSKR